MRVTTKVIQGNSIANLNTNKILQDKLNNQMATEKKITRTKIEYYPQCQGCGAPREEGKDTCEYCGRK